MSRLIPGLAAAAFLIATSNSTARADDQPSPNSAAETFAQLDANQDGQLTADEIPAEKKRLFERLLRIADKNGDSRLSRDEFVVGLERKTETAETAETAKNASENDDKKRDPERMFKRLDANRDGKVSLDEVPEPRQEMFKRLLERAGKTGDNSLSKQEFVQNIQGLRDKLAGKPENEKRPEGDPNSERIFRRMDKNGDGKVTLDEIPEERRKGFERIISRADKDGDKALTLAEFTAGFRGGPRPPQGAAPPAAIGGRLPPRGGLFAALDADHDGKLSAEEIAASPEKLKKLDTNGDGTITIDELLPPPE